MKKDPSTQNALVTPYTADTPTSYIFFILKKGDREPNELGQLAPALPRSQKAPEWVMYSVLIYITSTAVKETL